MNSVIRALQSRAKSNSLFNSHLNFIRAMVTDLNVASIAPSSSVTTRAICSQIDFDTVEKVVEFGPGDGAVTRALLQKLRPSARLFAIESNDSFVSTLEENITDPRLTVLHGDARNYLQMMEKRSIVPDLIVSGIPFSMFSDDEAIRLLRDVKRTVNPAGQFLLYQAWIPPFFTARRCRELLSAEFKEAGTCLVYQNLPPLIIISANPRPG